LPTTRPRVEKGRYGIGVDWPLLVALVGLAAVFCVFLAASIRTAVAQSASVDVRFFNPMKPCHGDCAVYLSFGQLIDEDMTRTFGLSSALVPDARVFVAPWDYDYEDSFLVSAALSRQLFSVGSWASGAIETGIGQRVGDLHATEIWAAIYLRWHAFPWSEILRTSVGISTGLNYATRIEAWERSNDRTGKGAHLLHYLAPELSLALPDVPQWEMVLRYHHRSGGGQIFGDTAIFNGVSGASNHVMAGIRHTF
jgi:hypothetical protein